MNLSGHSDTWRSRKGGREPGENCLPCFHQRWVLVRWIPYLTYDRQASVRGVQTGQPVFLSLQTPCEGLSAVNTEVCGRPPCMHARPDFLKCDVATKGGYAYQENRMCHLQLLKPARRRTDHPQDGKGQEWDTT